MSSVQEEKAISKLANVAISRFEDLKIWRFGNEKVDLKIRRFGNEKMRFISEPFRFREISFFFIHHQNLKFQVTDGMIGNNVTCFVVIVICGSCRKTPSYEL